MARVVQGRGVGAAGPPAARRPTTSRPGPVRAASARPAARPEPPPRLPRLRAHPIAAMEAGSRALRDPVEKLRFLRRSLDRYEALDARLQAVPGAPLRWLAYRVTGVEEARPLFSSNPWGALDPPRRSRPPLPRRARRAVNVAALLVVTAAGLALAAYPRSKPAPAALPPAPAAAPATESLDPLPRGVAPARIWMADSGPGFELYSNGLRIDTTYAVGGRAEALPRVRGRAGDGGRGARPAGRDRVPHVGERHLAARGVLQREAARLEPEPAALPEEEPRLPLPDRPLRAGLPGGGGDRRRRTTPACRSGAPAAACTST